MTVVIPEAVEAVGSVAESGSGAAARAGSSRGASARRKVVLGASTGPREPAQGQTRTMPAGDGATRKPRRKGTGKRAYSGARKGYKFATGKENGSALMIEYLAGVFVLVFGSVTRGSKQGYTTVMSELVIRLTALTAVFFVLFLLAGTKAGKTAMWFGLLVDLGVILTASSQDVFADLANAIQGKALTDPSTTATLDAATVTANTSPGEPEPAVTLPDSYPGAGGKAATTV